MKISVCIPQYNRIQYLLKSLSLIGRQTYSNIEIIISDDASIDETEYEINKLIPVYKYPIIYSRNKKNMGYDYNYRKCIELANGTYAFVIGNDDSLYGEKSIQFLVGFLQQNSYPDIGFCNMVEERTNYSFIERAHKTAVIGSGPETALKYYSSFSFVGGLIYKKSSFDKYNTDKYDGSVYAQLYLGCLMIANGCILFSIQEPLVMKDLVVTDAHRNSYRDKIATNWRGYRKVNGGLPSVINVLIASFRDAGVLSQRTIYRIYKRIYSTTFPFWIQDYKSNHAFPEAIGLVHGMFPYQYPNFSLLNFANRLKVTCIYFLSSGIALVFPNFLFNKIKDGLYKRMKK